MAECSLTNCGDDAYAKGMCHKHYDKNRLYGNPHRERPVKLTVQCSVEGCEADVACQQLCNKHYTRWKRHRSTDDLQPRECEICGRLFDPPGRRSFVCGDAECVRQRKLRNNRNSAKNRETVERKVRCIGCGKCFSTTSKRQDYCGSKCPGRKVVPSGPLRRAMLDGDFATVQELLKKRTDLSENGCWIWNGTLSEAEYPQVGFSKPIEEGGRATFLAHRS